MPSSLLHAQVKGALLQKSLPLAPPSSRSLEGYLLQDTPQGLRLTWRARGPRASRHHLVVAAGVLRSLGFRLRWEEGSLLVTSSPSTAPR